MGLLTAVDRGTVEEEVPVEVEVAVRAMAAVGTQGTAVEDTAAGSHR